MVESHERIRALNDTLRVSGIGGKIMLSRGVAALDEETGFRILRAVALFDDFTEDNDPYGEHDCAIVSFDGYRVMFKIDYYDPTMQYHSEDAGDPSKTVRVMTVMLPEEY